MTNVDPWASPGVLRARRALLALAIVPAVSAVLGYVLSFVITRLNYSLVRRAFWVEGYAWILFDVALFAFLFELGFSRFGGKFATWAAYLVLPLIGFSVVGQIAQVLPFGGGGALRNLFLPNTIVAGPAITERLVFLFRTAVSGLTIAAFWKVGQHGTRPVPIALVGLAGALLAAHVGLHYYRLDAIYSRGYLDGPRSKMLLIEALSGLVTLGTLSGRILLVVFARRALTAPTPPTVQGSAYR